MLAINYEHAAEVLYNNTVKLSDLTFHCPFFPGLWLSPFVLKVATCPGSTVCALVNLQLMCTESHKEPEHIIKEPIMVISSLILCRPTYSNKEKEVEPDRLTVCYPSPSSIFHS